MERRVRVLSRRRRRGGRVSVAYASRLKSGCAVGANSRRVCVSQRPGGPAQACAPVDRRRRPEPAARPTLVSAAIVGPQAARGPRFACVRLRLQRWSVSNTGGRPISPSRGATPSSSHKTTMESMRLEGDYASQNCTQSKHPLLQEERRTPEDRTDGKLVPKTRGQLWSACLDGRQAAHNGSKRIDGDS